MARDTSIGYEQDQNVCCNKAHSGGDFHYMVVSLCSIIPSSGEQAHVCSLVTIGNGIVILGYSHRNHGLGKVAPDIALRT